MGQCSPTRPFVCQPVLIFFRLGYTHRTKPRSKIDHDSHVSQCNLKVEPHGSHLSIYPFRYAVPPIFLQFTQPSISWSTVSSLDFKLGTLEKGRSKSNTLIRGVNQFTACFQKCMFQFYSQPTTQSSFASRTTNFGTMVTSFGRSHRHIQQAKLDAAIALFRSEASASGYVVEEVRLRLPVPYVDITPRVIIAQQANAEASTSSPEGNNQHYFPYSPFTFEQKRLKHSVDALSDPKIGNSFNNTSITRFSGDCMPPQKISGLKRTVSGSVIINPSPRTLLSPVLDTEIREEQCPYFEPNKFSFRSAPHLKPTKHGILPPKNRLKPKTQFWKTVIDRERDEMGMKAIENSSTKHQKINNATPGSSNSGKVQLRKNAEQPNTLEESKGIKVSKQENCKRVTKTSNDSSKGYEGDENTLHINGHNIPRSHVQLLLSSVADISARECEVIPSDPALKRKDETQSPGVTDKQAFIKADPLPGKKVMAPKICKQSSERLIRKYSASRPFRCPTCPSSFDREGHLRVHILAVHEKKRPFVCQVCDASFGHSSSLLRHVRTVHISSPGTNPGKIKMNPRVGTRMETTRSKSESLKVGCDINGKHFRCSACGLSFNKVSVLNRHVAEKHPVSITSLGKLGA